MNKYATDPPDPNVHWCDDCLCDFDVNEQYSISDKKNDVFYCPECAEHKRQLVKEALYNGQLTFTKQDFVVIMDIVEDINVV